MNNNNLIIVIVAMYALFILTLAELVHIENLLEAMAK